MFDLDSSFNLSFSLALSLSCFLSHTHKTHENVLKYRDIDKHTYWYAHMLIAFIHRLSLLEFYFSLSSMWSSLQMQGSHFVQKEAWKCQLLPAHGNIHPRRQDQMTTTTITTARTEKATASTMIVILSSDIVLTSPFSSVPDTASVIEPALSC